MQKIFIAKNYLEMQIIRDLLLDNNIECMTKGENSMSSGLAAMDLPPVIVENSIHIYNESDREQALKLINEYFNYTVLENDWICSNCNEVVPKEFMQCWNCSSLYNSDQHDNNNESID